MGLLMLVRFGYVLMTVAGAALHPPCVFNPLCSCSKSLPDLGLVFCEDVPLLRIPPAINSSKVFMLHLENNGLSSVEPYFLQGTGLYRLEISRNLLPTVPDEAFFGLERSLWELKLQYNDLTDVPSRALRQLQKLRLLDLTGNDIGELATENWRGLENSLQTLILADNALRSLPAEAFSSLTLLEILDLRTNHLAELNLDVFRSGPSRLSRLLLADNQLNSVPYQQVGTLRTLKTLDLASNNIERLHSEHQASGAPLSLDALNLDFNKIELLPSRAFQHFDILNKTFLDGNPLVTIESDAFRDARIRDLSIRGCGLTNLHEGAFAGLEATLQALDLGSNNLTDFPRQLLSDFDFLRTLALQGNRLATISSSDTLKGFQYSLYRLDLSGPEMGITSLQDLRRMRNLRFASLSRLPRPHLSPEDFEEFGVDLEELRVTNSELWVIKNNAFRHVRGLKALDLSENVISQLENEAFTDVGHSLETLKVSHGLAASVSSVPAEALRPLTNVQHLDLSNNRLRSVPETSFHFLKRLRVLELQHNQIDAVQKGTFQGVIHVALEELHLSFNSLESVNMHTFVDLPSLEELRLEDNKIARIDRRAFMNMDRLKRLDLRGNKLRDISDEAFQNLPELELLNLAYNKLQSLDFSMLDQVGTLSSFRLNVSHNALQLLEPNATKGRGGEVSNVRVLDLSYNNITRVVRNYLRPAERSLTHLHLSHNRLSNATREVFGGMPHLQWLDLSDNELAELEYDVFRNTRTLQVLILSHNKLANIPAEVFRPTSGLRVLDASHNKLRSLPDALFSDGGMERLALAHNQFPDLPLSSLRPAAAATLRELDLSSNSIASLSSPDVLSRFKSLMRLDISHNHLLRIDDSAFSTLGRLSFLDLSHNSEVVLDPRGRSFKGLESSLLQLHLRNASLGSVPELTLPALRTLCLAHNHIQDVPIEMASSLASLQRLDVSYNQLQTVPSAARSLPRLRHLELAANPITTLSNASFQGAIENLQSLDIRHLELIYFEHGALSRMTSLRTLYVSPYSDVRDFNIPQRIQQNSGLRNLHIQVLEESDLEKELSGPLPSKVRNITISGERLESVPQSLFKGVRSPSLHFTLRNTSVKTLPRSLFEQTSWVRNLSIDVRNNSLQSLGNPNTGEFPGVPRKMFTTELQLEGNRWTCDCQLGWIEVWLRKKRQYLCPEGRRECLEDDDLREARCENHNNESLIEVLKSEVECGWGSGSPATRPSWVLEVAVIGSTVIRILGHGVPDRPL